MTNRWAADRKITGNEVAYFNALYNGLRLSFPGELNSTMHCLKRRKKGMLCTVKYYIGKKSEWHTSS